MNNIQLFARAFFPAAVLVLFFLLTSISTQAQEQAPMTVNDLYIADLGEEEDSTITISWSEPTTKANGDRLDRDHIGGYKIYVTFPNGGNDTIDIVGNSINQHTMPADQGAGEYVFAMATYDINKLHGQLSDPVSAEIVDPGSMAPSKIEGINVTNVCRSGARCSFIIN